MNKPVFIIGSPRSGTSILTWCLGQHSNILVQEESNWLGRFSIDVEAAYRAGTQRGERTQLSALGVRREVFFATFGQAINELVLSHRAELTKTARERALTTGDHSPEVPEFQYERSASDPKKRWVDGTPEYSFYVCGLRKLFPEALFIHIVRNAAAVVRSILHFERAGGRGLVTSEEDGYAYWLRRVNACALAERAYGPGVVHRVRHADLVAQPEVIMRGLLEFLHEPYEVACLDPLRLRINSSDVPVDFEARHPATNRKVIAAALALESELIDGEPPVSASSVAASELEAEFENQVRHVQNVSDYHTRAVNRIAQLEKEMEKLKTAESNKQRRRWFPNKK
jgi:Sulfotransferase family